MITFDHYLKPTFEEYQPPVHIVEDHGFTQFTSFNSSKFHQNISIKKTKNVLREIINEHARITFHDLCKEYEVRVGNVQINICFVSALHLANELQLEVINNNEGEL